MRFMGSHATKGSSIIRKCETFGCRKIARQMYQLAPGTNIWLCDRCIEELQSEKTEIVRKLLQMLTPRRGTVAGANC